MKGGDKMESLLDLIWNPEDENGIEPMSLNNERPMRHNCMICLCESMVSGCGTGISDTIPIVGFSAYKS